MDLTILAVEAIALFSLLFILEITLEQKHNRQSPSALVAPATKMETAAALEQSPSKTYALIGLCLLIGSIALRYAILAAGIKVSLGL